MPVYSKCSNLYINFSGDGKSKMQKLIKKNKLMTLKKVLFINFLHRKCSKNINELKKTLMFFRNIEFEKNMMFFVVDKHVFKKETLMFCGNSMFGKKH